MQRLFYFFIVFFCRYEVVAEQKARATYDNILRVSDDPDVNDVIKFLREREIVHFHRFGEIRNKVNEAITSKNKFFMGENPCMKSDL